MIIDYLSTKKLKYEKTPDQICFPLYKINIRQNKVKNEMKLEMDCN